MLIYFYDTLNNIELTHVRNNQIMTQKQQLPSVIFREYDIRGKVGIDLHLDQIYDLGCAIAYFFKQKNPDIKTVALGMDGRVHSPEIKKQLCAAFADSGLDVQFVGLCHSPALYFAMYNLPVQAGVMITASHNPKEYNGLKICLGKENIWGSDIQKLYTDYIENKKIESNMKGAYSEHLIIPAYIDWLVEHFQDLKGMDLSAVIDCGNGAAGAVIPQLVKRMAWENVKILYPEVDGTYPNHEADPVNIENMQDVKKVLETTDIQVGIGLDGDADRMAPMTKKGQLVSGDLLLGLFAQEIAAQNSGVAVVFDIKSSAALINYLEQLGAQPVIAPSGHSIVKDAMKKNSALLAGELSCHFFFKDRYFGYDDGVYAMLRLFQMLQKEQKTLDELLQVYPEMYTSDEFRIACDEDKKKLIVQTVKDIFAQKEDANLLVIDGVRATMPYGWGLLRASNTQPVLSIRFESKTADGLQKVKDDFIHALRPFYKKDVLEKIFE